MNTLSTALHCHERLCPAICPRKYGRHTGRAVRVTINASSENGNVIENDAFRDTAVSPSLTVPSKFRSWRFDCLLTSPTNHNSNVVSWKQSPPAEGGSTRLIASAFSFVFPEISIETKLPQRQ